MPAVSRRFVLGGLVAFAAPAVTQAKMWPVVDGPSRFNDELDKGAKQWFKNAKNGNDVPCCDTADGFRRGYRYLVAELIGNEVKTVERLMFRTIARKGPMYELNVYDVVTHSYITLWASTPERVKQPDNPTGCDIAWIGHRGKNTQEIFIRCFCLGSES